jgi:hypothetical protein
LGNGSPAKNDWDILNALLGWNMGTSCPAPLTEANVSPSYTSDHPPTCADRCRYQQDDCLKLNCKCQSAIENSVYLSSQVPWVPADLDLQTKMADCKPCSGNRDNWIRIATAVLSSEEVLCLPEASLLNLKYNLLTSDSSAYLNTHILNPVFISIL